MSRSATLVYPCTVSADVLAHDRPEVPPSPVTAPPVRPHPALPHVAWLPEDLQGGPSVRGQGNDAMKVLVTAASRHGATTEVAASIGAVLQAAGLDVHVLTPSEVRCMDGFDVAVIGSAIYVGRWLEPARELVEREKVALCRIHVWLFSSGPVGDPPRPVEESLDAAPLTALVGARDHCTFAGQLVQDRLGFGERALMAAVRAPEGDFRPWPEIEAWAREIAATLNGSGPTA